MKLNSIKNIGYIFIISWYLIISMGFNIHTCNMSGEQYVVFSLDESEEDNCCTILNQTFNPLFTSNNQQFNTINANQLLLQSCCPPDCQYISNDFYIKSIQNFKKITPLQKSANFIQLNILKI